jgi:polyhydroxyalkanoate synthase
MAALGRNFSDFVAHQQATVAAHAPAAGNSFPVPESAALVALQQKWAENQQKLWQAFAQRKPEDGTPRPRSSRMDPSDRRFRAAEWSSSPYFDYLRQAYVLNAAFMRECVEATPVADGRAKDRLRYMSKQMIEAMSPANFAATNPEFVQTALRTEGESIRKGMENLLRDLQQGHISMSAPGAFEVGRNLAVTPGTVVFENGLIQLIQYAPLTDKVHAKPLLIVPPCINKYYLMDLQPENSLVRFLVEKGITVFLVSWRNPDNTLAHLTWEDYLRLGPLTALDVVRDISGDPEPNTMGFCVGGTILASALAVACGRGEKPAASMTLLTTLLDFSDAGELACLIDEGMVTARENTIGRGGLLNGRELSQTFSSLRPNDLIWNYVVGNYLKGETPAAFDILHWNCDSTNLPGPFLAWYMRNLYLENSLRVPGKLEVLGVRLDLGKVICPPTCSPPRKITSCRGPVRTWRVACWAAKPHSFSARAAMSQAPSIRFRRTNGRTGLAAMNPLHRNGGRMRPNIRAAGGSITLDGWLNGQARKWRRRQKRAMRAMSQSSPHPGAT